jgi:hypothetical protein
MRRKATRTQSNSGSTPHAHHIDQTTRDFKEYPGLTPREQHAAAAANAVMIGRSVVGAVTSVEVERTRRTSATIATDMDRRTPRT